MDITEEVGQDELMQSCISLITEMMVQGDYSEAVSLVEFLGALYSNMATVFIVNALRFHDKECGGCDVHARLLVSLQEFITKPNDVIQKSVQQNLIMHNLTFPGWTPTVPMDDPGAARQVAEILKEAKKQKLSLHEVLKKIKETPGIDMEVVDSMGLSRPPDSELN